jgi:acetoin utilization deacetylase AcuC-like enzyme
VADYRIRIAAPLYFRHESSLAHDTGAHPERIGRIQALEQAMRERDWLDFEVREAPQVDLSVLEAVHTREHIDHIRLISEHGGGSLDPDTIASPGTYDAALHSAGGAVALVDALMDGDTHFGFSGLRPPGHHAERSAAMGFCFFNNIAVAAQRALDAHGAERVFILDWDVHHGNGTAHLFASTPQVLFTSIHQWPCYPGTGRLDESGEGEGEGYTINLPVPPGSGEDVWLPLVEHIAIPAARAYGADLVLVSAGFDAHRRDPLADCLLETTSFAQMALHVRVLAESLGLPVGVVLEGGYDLEALSMSVVASLEALRDGGEPRSLAAEPVTERAASQYRRWWPL